MTTIATTAAILRHLVQLARDTEAEYGYESDATMATTNAVHSLVESRFPGHLDSTIWGDWALKASFDDFMDDAIVLASLLEDTDGSPAMVKAALASHLASL